MQLDQIELKCVLEGLSELLEMKLSGFDSQWSVEFIVALMEKIANELVEREQGGSE